MPFFQAPVGTVSFVIFTGNYGPFSGTIPPRQNGDLVLTGDSEGPARLAAVVLSALTFLIKLLVATSLPETH